MKAFLMVLVMLILNGCSRLNPEQAFSTAKFEWRIKTGCMLPSLDKISLKENELEDGRAVLILDRRTATIEIGRRFFILSSKERIQAMLHEIGHWLGLSHHEKPSIMYPEIEPGLFITPNDSDSIKTIGVCK